jgi:hypothetical protein
MITLFDAHTSQFLNITEFRVNPMIKWVAGAVLSGAISWAGWTTNEVLKANSVANDVHGAIMRLDSRFAAIDNRLERIETMLMQQGTQQRAR